MPDMPMEEEFSDKIDAALSEMEPGEGKAATTAAASQAAAWAIEKPAEGVEMASWAIEKAGEAVDAAAWAIERAGGEDIRQELTAEE